MACKTKKLNMDYKHFKNPTERKTVNCIRVFLFTLIGLLGVILLISGLFLLITTQIIFYKQIGGILLGLGCLMVIILSVVLYYINSRESVLYDSKDSYSQRANLATIHNRAMRELEIRRPIYRPTTWTNSKTHAPKVSGIDMDNAILMSAYNKDFIIEFEEIDSPLKKPKNTIAFKTIV